MPLLRPLKAALLLLLLGLPALRAAAQAPVPEPAAQIVDSVLRTLNTQDFAVFQQFMRHVARVHTQDAPPWVHFERFRVRELLPGYEEARFRFGVGVPAPEISPGSFRSTEYHLHVIHDGKRPVYYQLAIGGYDRKADRLLLEPRPSVRDSEGYARLETEYQALIGAPLRLDDLFRHPEVVYGSGCGKVSTPIPEQLEIDRLVARRDTAALTSWLQSACAERQVFGVQGCHRLREAGLPPTPRQLRLIRLIQQKNGKMSTCSGCSYSSYDNIRDVAGQFGF